MCPTVMPCPTPSRRRWTAPLIWSSSCWNRYTHRDRQPKQEVDGHDLRAALDAVLEGNAVSESQKASIGCNIKWRPGNEPDYF